MAAAVGTVVALVRWMGPEIVMRALEVSGRADGA